jgi:hypothetical protein
LLQLSLVLYLLFLFCGLDILPQLLLHLLSFHFKAPLHVLLQVIQLRIVLGLDFPLLNLESLDVRLVRIETLALLLAELFQFEFKTLLLSLLYCLSDPRVLLNKSGSFLLELFVNLPLIVT